MAAEKAKKQGVKVRLSVYEGMFHVFQMAMHLMPESRHAWKEAGRFIQNWKSNSKVKVMLMPNTHGFIFSFLMYEILDIKKEIDYTIHYGISNSNLF